MEQRLSRFLNSIVLLSVPTSTTSVPKSVTSVLPSSPKSSVNNGSDIPTLSQSWINPALGSPFSDGSCGVSAQWSVMAHRRKHFAMVSCLAASHARTVHLTASSTFIVFANFVAEDNPSFLRKQSRLGLNQRSSDGYPLAGGSAEPFPNFCVQLSDSWLLSPFSIGRQGEALPFLEESLLRRRYPLNLALTHRMHRSDISLTSSCTDFFDNFDSLVQR